MHRILGRLSSVKHYFDMNLRDGHWNLPLVQRLSGQASIVKLNETGAEKLFRLTHANETLSLEKLCRPWSSVYDVGTMCVTPGSQGCAIFIDDILLRFGGFSVKVVDTVGAGDAFAAAFLHGYGLQWPIADIASFANALGALVASRTGATPAWAVDECRALIAEQKSGVLFELQKDDSDPR